MAVQKASAQSSPNIDVNTPYTPRRPAPLVSISVNHPFATALRKVKNFLIHKQTLFSTTFSIKITPIVAIVSLFGLATLFGGGITTAFTFGKTVEQKLLATMPTPTPKVIVALPLVMTVSQAGTIKATYQLPPGDTNPSPSDFPATGNMQPASGSGEITVAPTRRPSPTPIPLHYILVSRTGSIIFLTSTTSIHLQNYLGLRVLITGSLDSTKNTLTVVKPGDIEVLQ